MRRLWPLLLGLAALAGCVLPEISLDGRACPCVDGFVCVEGQCVRGEGPPDAALDGGGAPDASPADGGRPDLDGDVLDTGVADAGPIDAADTGVTDTGGADTGVADTGASDAGPDPDAGVDAGAPDAGPAPCVTDQACAPPATVCQAGVCAPGCDQPGAPACVGGLTCDVATGRCFNAGAPCGQDADCGAGPPEGVCRDGTCAYGCQAAAGACVQDRMCMPNGHCEVAPSCLVDADCGQPDFVCSGSACTRRCDLPGAALCLGNGTCNPASGLCEGALALGQDCAAEAECRSGLCLSIQTPTMQSFCSRACGAASDCPLDMTCLPVDGARLCIRETVFSPALQLDTRAGAACANPGNTCQSLVCTANVCTERCQQDSHCDPFGGECVMTRVVGGGGEQYIPLCLTPTGGGAPGDVCPNDDDALCASGICNRYFDQCQTGCCGDADCGVNESCVVYDLTASDPFPTCQPRSGSAGNLTLGNSCSAPADCDSEVCAPRDPANLGGPRSCTTHCCTDADCAAYPGGGRCAPMPALGTVAQVNYCVPLTP